MCAERGNVAGWPASAAAARSRILLAGRPPSAGCKTRVDLHLASQRAQRYSISRTGKTRCGLHRTTQPVVGFAVAGTHGFRRRFRQGGVLNGARGKTLFDRGLAMMLVVFAPVWLVLALLRLRHSLKLLPVARVGCGGEVFYMEQPLAPASRVAQLARCKSLLLNIWRGELSFVGPRARLPEEFDWTDPALARHLQVRPGLLCLWWLRRRTNIAYNREWECDAEYIATPPSVTNDLGILLRALLVWCFGRPRTVRQERVQLLGLQINNLTMDATLDWLLARLAVAPGGGTEAAQVSFVNADCANLAYRDAEYLRVVNGSALVLADGIGMKLAGQLLGQELQQNVNGTDLFPSVCRLGRCKNAGFPAWRTP